MTSEKQRFASDHLPFLFLGVICWLCGAVVVGVAASYILGKGAAIVAIALVTVLLLAVFWKLGTAAAISVNTGGKS